MLSSLKVFRLVNTLKASFGITDSITRRNQKKQKKEFKEEIQNLANKPSFTFQDYKQRIKDTVSKSKSGLKSLMSSQESTQNLQKQLKVMNCLFDEELTIQQSNQLKDKQKEQISKITEMGRPQINQCMKKFDYYRKLWKLMRGLKLNNQDLPESPEEIRALLIKNRGSLHSLQEKKRNFYQSFKSRSPKASHRYTKWGKFSLMN